MVKMIVTGGLGFLTPPMIILTSGLIVEAGKLIAGLGMEPIHYWGGFFLFIGLTCTVLATLPFWNT